MNDVLANIRTIGDCVEYCESFEHSIENYDLLKTLSEISLMESWVENNTWVVEHAESIAKYGDMFTEAFSPETIEQLKLSIKEKSTNFFEKIRKGFERVAGMFVKAFRKFIGLFKRQDPKKIKTEVDTVYKSLDFSDNYKDDDAFDDIFSEAATESPLRKQFEDEVSEAYMQYAAKTKWREFDLANTTLQKADGKDARKFSLFKKIYAMAFCKTISLWRKSQSDNSDTAARYKIIFTIDEICDIFTKYSVAVKHNGYEIREFFNSHKTGNIDINIGDIAELEKASDVLEKLSDTAKDVYKDSEDKNSDETEKTLLYGLYIASVHNFGVYVYIDENILMCRRFLKEAADKYKAKLMEMKQQKA